MGYPINFSPIFLYSRIIYCVSLGIKQSDAQTNIQTSALQAGLPRHRLAMPIFSELRGYAGHINPVLFNKLLIIYLTI